MTYPRAAAAETAKKCTIWANGTIISSADTYNATAGGNDPYYAMMFRMQ